MARRIRRRKKERLRSYDRLSQRILAIARAKPLWMDDLIPDEIGAYWRIGQTLVWCAEDILEDLALKLRRSGKPWQARDLEKMVRLYFRYPTVERLWGGCVLLRGRITLDELLKIGR